MFNESRFESEVLYHQENTPSHYTLPDETLSHGAGELEVTVGMFDICASSAVFCLRYCITSRRWAKKRSEHHQGTLENSCHSLFEIPPKLFCSCVPE